MRDAFDLKRPSLREIFGRFVPLRGISVEDINISTHQHLLSLHHKLLVIRDIHAWLQSVERLAARAHLLAGEVVDVAGTGRLEVDILDA